MWAEEVADRVRRQFCQILCQFGLRIAPGEIGIGLGETELRQAIHQFRAGECLRQKDRIGKPNTYFGNHPLPERQRLGVRIVDAKQPHALAGTEENDVAQGKPQ